MSEEAVLHVYENTNVMPRATLVARSRPARSREEALALVARADFDPRTEIVLEGGTPASISAPASPAASAGDVRIERYEPELIQVAADVAPGGSWLLLSEVFFPGWTATVDGAPVAILRGNALFRTVRLEGGRHEVVFRYEPPSFRRGLQLSALGATLLLVLFGAAAVKRLRSPALSPR